MASRSWAQAPFNSGQAAVRGEVKCIVTMFSVACKSTTAATATSSTEDLTKLRKVTSPVLLIAETASSRSAKRCKSTRSARSAGWEPRGRPAVGLPLRLGWWRTKSSLAAIACCCSRLTPSCARNRASQASSQDAPLLPAGSSSLPSPVISSALSASIPSSWKLFSRTTSSSSTWHPSLSAPPVARIKARVSCKACRRSGSPPLSGCSSRAILS
mmetsp:Transcript_59242/g.149984  ORF Transcript_59242/g.149984 Transcript_59242/m.149984 type:complete len:214 (-) Transcript_59242:243-884(-)